MSYESREPAAVAAGTPIVSAPLDPTTGAQAVAIVGGEVAATIDSLPLPSGAATAAAQTDGTQKAKVTDQPCTIAGAGQKTAGTSAAVTSNVSGAGYLTIKNTDPSVTAYIGVGTVDNTKFPLTGGDSITFSISDVTTVNCYSAGSPVLGWLFLQTA